MKKSNEALSNSWSNHNQDTNVIFSGRLMSEEHEKYIYDKHAIYFFGEKIGLTFDFKNENENAIQSLEIEIMTNPPCELNIVKCLKGTFEPQVEHREILGGIFRYPSNAKRVAYYLNEIRPHQIVNCEMLVHVKKMEGHFPRHQIPGCSVEFATLTIAPQAVYKFENNENQYFARLSGIRILTPQHINFKERVAKALQEQWIELLVVALFGWIIGSILPSPAETLQNFWQWIVGLAH